MKRKKIRARSVSQIKSWKKSQNKTQALSPYPDRSSQLSFSLSPSQFFNHILSQLSLSITIFNQNRLLLSLWFSRLVVVVVLLLLRPLCWGSTGAAATAASVIHLNWWWWWWCCCCCVSGLSRLVLLLLSLSLSQVAPITRSEHICWGSTLAHWYYSSIWVNFE